MKERKVSSCSSRPLILCRIRIRDEEGNRERGYGVTIQRKEQSVNMALHPLSLPL